MSIEDVLLALRAAEEGAIDRDTLTKVLSIIDTWDRGGLHPSGGELLTKHFRVDSTKVRRWESEITGQSQRRIGRYQLRRKVGQGGMGIVFEAEDPNLGRTVALKLLASDRLESPESVQRFLREAKSAGSFNHPNIVHAYDAGIDGDLPYLVMEFVDGENLYQVLKRRGPIPPAEVLDWLIQGARALDVLERKRWVHGDVKPSNFILTRDGEVKLADLGLCGPPGKPRPGVSPHGTPPYIAPEVLAGETIDHRADLYSLGATAYHLLVGRPPRVSRTIDALREEITTRVVPLTDACAAVSPALATIIMRLLETAPKQRFPDGRRLLRALEVLVPTEVRGPDNETLAIAEPPPSTGGSGGRAVWLAVGAVVIVIGVVIGVAAGPGGGGERGENAGDRSAGAGTPAATDATGVDPDPATALTPELVQVGAEWERFLSEHAGDFPRLYRWLAVEGSDHPSVETWRTALTAELSRVAGSPWSELESELLRLRFEGAYSAALAALASFPEGWRAGPYAVAWEEMRRTIEGERRDRLARWLLALEGAPDTLAALRVFRSLASENLEDADWYRARALEESGDLPFLRAIETAVLEARRTREDRSDEVARALAAGELPSPRFAGLTPEGTLRETALHWLTRYPRVGGTAGPLLPRLHAADALADAEPALLATLLALVGESAAVEAEITAARIERELAAAQGAFAIEAADRAWERLGAPEFSETIAARTALAARSSDRQHLVRAAFLRSDAFIAEVSGGWRGPVRLRWDPRVPRFDEEWRYESSRFAITETGLRARGSSSWQSLELAVPFEPTFTLDCTFHPPRGEWSLFVGQGGNALGLAGNGSDRAARVIAGEANTVADLLSAGRGLACALVPDPNRVGAFRLRISVEEGAWTLEGGPTFALPDTQWPPWIRIAVPTEASVDALSVTGTVVEPWLRERQRRLGGD